MYETKKSVPVTQREALQTRLGCTPASASVFSPAIETDMDEACYKKRFSKVKNYIAQGDIYQLNLTFKALFHWPDCPVKLYSLLRPQQIVEYGGMILNEDFSLLSFSPELFFQTHKNKIITAPMKGTIRRGDNRQHDVLLKSQLQNDIKNRAENLMITDLMRNDLSRVCQAGTVKVPKLFHIETLPTLHQMISVVEGTLKPTIQVSDILQCLFPAGSIIGAPKIRAQEIIHQLETGPRSVYTGSMGYISPDGNTRFNVAIRTLKIDANGHAEMGIGSGIVQDSKAEEEYDECLLKMAFLNEALCSFSSL